MIIKPKALAVLIIFSFLLVLITVNEAHNPISVVGFIFWLSFAVFAFCCTHLSKNEDYYKQFIDNDL